MADATPDRLLIIWEITAKLWRGTHTVPDPRHRGSSRLKRTVSIVPAPFDGRIAAAEARVGLLRSRYTRVWKGQARVGTVHTVDAILREAESIRGDVRRLMADLLDFGIDRLLEEARQMWSSELRPAPAGDGDATPLDDEGRAAVEAIMAKYPAREEDLLEKFGGWEACGVGLEPSALKGVPEILREHSGSALARDLVARAGAELESQLESLVSGAREALVDVLERTTRQVAAGQRLDDSTFNDLHNGLILMRNFGAAGTARTLDEVNRTIAEVERIMAAARDAREGRRGDGSITERTREAAAGLTAAAAGLRRVLEDRTELEAARAQIGLSRRRRLAF